jgi:HEAT repeat protein
LRFEQGQLIKLRPVPVGCHLDADGVAFTWLTGVTQEESIAYLEKLATRDSSEKRAVEGAMVVLSYHASPEATRALTRIATSSAPLHVREQAAFWLGVKRGHEGFVALKNLADKTTDSGFREKLPFDFSQNSDPAAEDELLAMAKNDSDTKVREQAIFWIAQKAGKKAVGAISDAIENDPETDVKKRAVFALSQLPKEEGVPQLIHVADTNHNPVVRKEAIFWLGQSHDPRALTYLEAILKR